MNVEFSVKAHLEVESGKDKNSCTFKGARYALGLSPNLDKTKYIENDLPNQEGCKAATLVLVSALIANIHVAHDRGYWNDAEHLRFIIAELEEGFASNYEVEVVKT